MLEEAQVIGLGISLFLIMLGMQVALYHKMNKFTTTLTILCREHSINHKCTEIDCPD